MKLSEAAVVAFFPLILLASCTAPERRAPVDLTDDDARARLISALVNDHGMMMQLIDTINSNSHAAMMARHHMGTGGEMDHANCPDNEGGIEPQSGADSLRSPYAGDERRDIASLGAGDVQGYLNGEGMGFARAAELHHYPGPRHVLSMASGLRLSSAQLNETQDVYRDMHERAVSLGKELVRSEERLDGQFRGGSITPPVLEKAVAEIARLQGNIRAAHLAAHLKMRRLLSDDQVKRYDELRGYGSSSGHSSGR